MKKLIVSFIALLALSFAAGAQNPEKTWTIYSATGGANGLISYNLFTSDSDAYSLAGIYEPYYENRSGSPVFCVGMEHLVGRWLALSVDLNWSILSAEAHDGVTHDYIGSCDAMSFCVMPGVKAYWTRHERYWIYSGLDMGVCGLLISEGETSSFKPKFAMDFIPFGMSLRLVKDYDLYGFGEWMIGSRVLGGRLGIGIAF